MRYKKKRWVWVNFQNLNKTFGGLNLMAGKASSKKHLKALLKTTLGALLKNS